MWCRRYAQCGKADQRFGNATGSATGASNALAEDHQRAIESIKQADSAVKLAHEKFSALAAENAGLKAGHSYFSYGSEHNFEWHKTAEEAIESAEAAIDDYRGDACDGWSEEVDSICWGIIMQSSTKVGERPRNEDDCCDPAIDTICDYALLPNIDTPATDAFLAEIRAQGVEMFADNLLCPDLDGTIRDFAAQLRKGGGQK
ncbi:Uncharacterised protein [Escherichia coli]|nr:Uncharacterised protein [Escherichia coli]SQM34103.1 Uncharacterised protein [Escherichia coli]SRY03634.1 Uncharacterised protein [Escherichia coli]GDN17321.1 hypothetical protein BvCmsKSP071_03876 [Escherichia coli]GDN54342.1 hypothetical protein BvCmsKSP065_01247 [Escherichia coli]